MSIGRSRPISAMHSTSAITRFSSVPPSWGRRSTRQALAVRGCGRPRWRIVGECVSEASPPAFEPGGEAESRRSHQGWYGGDLKQRGGTQTASDQSPAEHRPGDGTEATNRHGPACSRGSDVLRIEFNGHRGKVELAADDAGSYEEQRKHDRADRKAH